MNHAFKASGDNDKCVICKFDHKQHSSEATCETCTVPGPVEIRYGNMLMCATCWEKELHTAAVHMSPENQQKRVDEMNAKMALERAKLVDSAIQVRTDIFNAETESIIALKKIIDDNPAIENKPYYLGSEIKARHAHLQKVAFELNEQLVETANRQKAIQIYLNTLANSLRAEEREKLKIQDINYKPGIVKPAKTIKTIKTTGTSGKVKFNKADLKKYAKEVGASEFTLQQICVAKGLTPEKAAGFFLESIAKLKSAQ